MTGDLDIPRAALDWHRDGTGAALATVIETWGSAPRPVGSQLAISGTGEMAGSVSGGCVEGAVVVESLDALRDGEVRDLTYGVSDDEAFAVGLACGGRIRVLVEPVGRTLDEALLAALIEALADRRPVAYVADLTGSDRRLETAGHAARFRDDRSGLEPDGRTFVGIFVPPLRLAVIGAVHIAQSLLPMARLVGYDATLIDPREAFGSAARFPGEPVRHDWPDAAVATFDPDARSAVVTLTHDPKLDDPAIMAALASPAFYIGCLGSTRTHAKRVARLEAAGVEPADLARLRAPVGLSIGARTPAEIAVAVMAEMTQCLRRS